MKAGIILVGTELLNGGTVDTNSIYIGEELNKYGIEMEFKMAVRDVREEIVKAIGWAKQNVDLVIMSGGLGPTIDDITKECIAAYLGLPLIVDPEDVRILERKFDAIHIPMIPSNIKQIEKPQGAISFPNGEGMAPGVYIDGIAAFPGIPRELYDLLPKFLAWYSREKKLAADDIYIRDILTYGLGESILDDKVKGLFTEPGIYYEFLVKAHGTIVRLQSYRHDKKNVEKIVKNIYNEIGEYIFGEGNDTLESVLVRELKARGMTLSTGESCTGGLIAGTVVNVPGASDVFREGFVTYSNEAKIKYLGVSPETLARHGAVSAETAWEMVKGLATTAGIASTGIAGPASDDTEKPVGLVYIAVRVGESISVKEYKLGGGRNRIRHRAALHGLFDLIRLLRRESAV